MSRLGIALAVMALSSCEPGVSPAPIPPSADTLYEAVATVLEGDGDGPVLCIGVLMDTLPPQCDGLPITNWRWADVEGEREASGSTWGEYRVVGTFDGRAFTVTDVRLPGPPPDVEGFDFGIPCPEPEAGWVARDPGSTSRDDLTAANLAARGREYAGSWIRTASGEPVRAVGEDTVLVVGYTDHLEWHESRLRPIWGGPLCVFEERRSFRRLMEIQEELGSRRGSVISADVLWSDIDVSANVVEIGVVRSTAGTQRQLDGRFGRGAVRQVPVLRPVE